MKKTLFFVLLIFNFLFIINLNAQNISYSNLRDGNGISVNMSMDSYDISTLNHKGEEMHEITVSGIVIPNDEGMPNLPRISRFVALPQGANANLIIKSVETEVVSNINIAPALRIQNENEEPEFNYSKNKKVYEKNEFYPNSPVDISEKTSLRGVDAVILGITPFQYNPVTKELIVIKNIELEINYEGGNSLVGDNKYRSRWFDPILKNALLNYEVLPEIDYAEVVANRSKDATGCEYLIVTPNNDEWAPYAEQLKEYRTKQGILTKVMRLDEMEVTNTNQLKSFFHNAYNTWEIPPVAILLMADHGTDMTKFIPAEIISHPTEGTCITDNQYVDVTGDYLPEMVFARMTASTIAELSVLVSKVLEYEYTNPCMDANYYQKPITALGWQTERWFQICSEVVGGYLRGEGKNPVRINAIYDGNPGSIWSTAQNTSLVVNYFGVNGLGYLPASPAELGGWSGGTAQDVINAVNSGAYILQHRDHGYEPGWGEPDFTTANIPSLNNVGKMTYVFSINCLTGKFNHSSKCFQEVFHLHQWQGQNAGAVGVLCPTSTSFSFVNDTYIWGVYDLFDPDFMPDYGPYADNSGNWLPAFGNVAGKYFLAQSSWPYNVNNKQITYQMFTAHSDAFLRLYTEVPQTLTVTHEEVSLAGNTNFNITATEGAMIALTLDGEILAVADATGVQQTIIIPATLIPTNEINVVCTKQNYLRYESVVTVVPADGPYVIGNNWVVNDDNHDEILQYGESATIDMTAKNVGIETASNVSMTISSESEHVTIIQNTANFGNIAADATATVNDAFEVLISEDVPNNTTILFDISSTDGNDVWASAMTIKVYRPILAYDDFSWQGSFEAGETLSFAIAFENKGGAPVNDVVGVLSSANQYVTIDVAEQAYGNILPNETGIAIFNVTLSDETPQSGLIEFNISVSGDEGMITADGSFGIENKCTIYFDMWDSSGDGWDSNGRISIRQNNIEIASVKLQSGSFGQTELSLPTGELDFVWIYGNNYDYENSFKIYNHDHELIYQTSGTPTAGSFLVYDNSCGQSGIICESPINLLAENEENIVTLSWESDGVNFIVKRDGVQIGSTTETQFIDNAAPFGLLEYSVTAICISGAVSDESKVNVEIAALYPPVKELHAEITDNNVYISWIEPTTKDFEISSFKIYRNDVEIANVFDAYYSDNNLLNGNYIYCVEVIYDDGETSDKICLDEIIIDICEIPANLNVNINVNNASLMWSETINPSQSYNVYRNNEIISNTTDTHFYDNDLNNGEYEYCIEAIYSNCTSERICFDLINIAVCHQPINLTHIAENNSVVLEWEKSPFVSSANYSVYRNDELLAENISETNYTDVNPVKGNSVYGVQANYNLECETSDPATLQVNYVGINNYDSNVKIYPNPAQNILNIEAKDMSKITIYNNSGQIVLKLDVNGDKTNVDVSKLNSGIYVLDIVDTNNSSIKTKVVITK